VLRQTTDRPLPDDPEGQPGARDFVPLYADLTCIIDDMRGELGALLIIVLLLAGAAYSGISARVAPRDQEGDDPNKPEDS